MYAYDEHLLHLRDYHIDQNLAAYLLRKGKATPLGIIVSCIPISSRLPLLCPKRVWKDLSLICVGVLSHKWGRLLFFRLMYPYLLYESRER